MSPGRECDQIFRGSPGGLVGDRHTRLEHENNAEHAQADAVFVSETSLDSNANLIISSEKVATAVVGQIKKKCLLEL